MLLVDRVTLAHGDTLGVATEVRPNAWYADVHGNMPAWIGVELMAQGIAAYFGLSQRREGKPIKIGFLLGTRRYSCHVPSFARGSVLNTTAHMEYREPNGLGAFSCHIDSGGQRLAQALIKVFEPESIEQFMQRAPA
jgi:predicted hotdog family 3-hydroxylacyl-ACP dehydratase